MEKFSVEYLEVVVKKHLPQLPKSAREMIRHAIEHRLVLDPISLGKPLRYSLVGHRRIRVSTYRVIYRIDPKRQAVTIVAIDHRKDVYEL